MKKRPTTLAKTNSVPRGLKVASTHTGPLNKASEGTAPLVTRRASASAKTAAASGATLSYSGRTKKRVAARPTFQRTSSEPVLSTNSNVSASIRERMSVFESSVDNNSDNSNINSSKSSQGFKRRGSAPVKSRSLQVKSSVAAAIAGNVGSPVTTRKKIKKSRASTGTAKSKASKRHTDDAIETCNRSDSAISYTALDKPNPPETGPASPTDGTSNSSETAPVSKAVDNKTTDFLAEQRRANGKKPLRQRPKVSRDKVSERVRRYSCSNLDTLSHAETRNKVSTPKVECRKSTSVVKPKPSSSIETSRSESKDNDSPTFVKIPNKLRSDSVLKLRSRRLSGKSNSWKVMSFEESQ